MTYTLPRISLSLSVVIAITSFSVPAGAQSRVQSGAPAQLDAQPGVRPGAQLRMPHITVNGTRHAAITPTPAEVRAHLANEDARTNADAIRALAAHYPKDSVLQISIDRARRWLASFGKTAATGIQIDPYGVISVLAGQDEVASQHISARLATPGLSLADKAYTLRVAVQAFSSAEFPARFATAERYLAQLDALGKDAAFDRFVARWPLLEAYYRLGRGDDIARIGVKGFELAREIDFSLREVAMGPMSYFTYGVVIDALSGQPDGRARINALNAILLAAATPSPELVAFDSMWVWHGETLKHEAEKMARVAERVGNPAAPIIMNYWANRGSTRDSATIPVNDGKIRVIEAGSFSCGSCMASLAGMERLSKQYPDVEFNFLTYTVGRWGNRMVDPRFEADKLAEHFIGRLGASFPIGIAMLPRVPNAEGDNMTDFAHTPVFLAKNYPESAAPTIYIVDGDGMIRRVILGFSRDLEPNVAAILDYLKKEKSQKARLAHVS